MSALDKLLRSDHVESFDKGSATKIKQFQKKYDVELSAEYQNFLLRCNGMYRSFDDDMRRKAGRHMDLTDINTFYGIGNGRAGSDLDVITAGYDANTRRLMGFAPTIAIGGDCCNLVEISRGVRARQIIYTDGEIHGSMLREADWSLSADALIEDFIESGFFMPVAASFAELLAMYLMIV